ncbi:response regulator [Actinoplanes octamycinicus]|nr:two-component system response regulator [Actinoplanes octamycinicus]
MIVDDDDADTLMIEEALLTAEPQPLVHRVSDGSEAMDYLLRRGEYADATRPDLILLDLNMPRMNGHEVLAQVKSDETLKSIPVVVLTTSTALPDITASYTQHANAFVTKPMDLDGFEEAVRKIKRFYGEVAILP